MESCCKHSNWNDSFDENENGSADEVDIVSDKVSVHVDDFKKNNGIAENGCGYSDDDVIDPNDPSVNSAVPCCAICLDKFDKGDDVSYSMDTTTCHHEYHTLCITEWLMKHPNCPYCRRNYIPLPATNLQPPSPPANATDTGLPTNVVIETRIESSNVPLTPEQALQPAAASTSSQRNPPYTRTFAHSVLLTSFWRRVEQQQLPRSDRNDIESGGIAIATSTNQASNNTSTSNDTPGDRAHDDFITL
jgi:hypothetical protein